MVSTTVSFLFVCLVVLIGVTEVQNNPLQPRTMVGRSSCAVDDLVPSEDCTMLCVCNEGGFLNPCFPMCPPVYPPICPHGEEWYSFFVKNEYGCLCEDTACGTTNFSSNNE